MIAKLVMKGELKILGCPTHALPNDKKNTASLILFDVVYCLRHNDCEDSDGISIYS